MFWILLFFFASLSGESAPSAMAHFESGLPCVAGGYVNVITGAPLLHGEDLVIPGVEPLSVTRNYHYDPLELKGQISGFHQSWDFNLSEHVSRSLDGEHSLHFTHRFDSQIWFDFHPPKGSKNEIFYDVSQSGKGSTNIGHGYPSGRHALKNTYFSETPPPPFSKEYSAVLVSGDGELKAFWGEKDKNEERAGVPIRWIKGPNGFKKIFHWGKDVWSWPKGLGIETPTGKTVGEIDIQHQKSGDYYKVGVWAPDERHAAYTFSAKVGGKRLLVVDSSDHPQIRYSYLRGDEDKRVETITLPESRGVKFSYWSENDRWIDQQGRHGKLSKHAQLLHKVKTIEQPVGPKPERIATHLFQYFQDDRKDPNWGQALTRVIFVLRTHRRLPL